MKSWEYGFDAYDVYVQYSIAQKYYYYGVV